MARRADSLDADDRASPRRFLPAAGDFCLRRNWRISALDVAAPPVTRRVHSGLEGSHARADGLEPNNEAPTAVRQAIFLKAEPRAARPRKERLLT